MSYIYKVIGHTLIERLGFSPAIHTDYEIVVSFDRWEDNQETVENFVTWYWSVDLKANPYEKYRVLTPENCARALAVFHFRENMTRFHDEGLTSISVVPAETPTQETTTFRLWITKQVKKEVFTALNAGWELYCRCEYSKLSVPEAQAFVRDKFPGQHFAWHEVLRAFSKEGGRYTAKYLRRD